MTGAGTVLQETTVTLWGPHKELLAEVRIGPADFKENGYVWKELEEAIPLMEHREYRITQECVRNMADPWWDGLLGNTGINVHHHSASDYAYITRGVSSG